MGFYQHFSKKDVSFMQKKKIMVMNLCPFNVKMLLIGMLQSERSDAGNTAGEIGNICPSLPNRTWV